MWRPLSTYFHQDDVTIIFFVCARCLSREGGKKKGVLLGEDSQIATRIGSIESARNKMPCILHHQPLQAKNLLPRTPPGGCKKRDDERNCCMTPSLPTRTQHNTHLTSTTTTTNTITLFYSLKRTM